MNGDETSAMDHLEKAAERNFAIDPRFYNLNSPFKSLQGNPRFDAFITRMTNYLNEERDKMGLEPFKDDSAA